MVLVSSYYHRVTAIHEYRGVEADTRLSVLLLSSGLRRPNSSTTSSHGRPSSGPHRPAAQSDRRRCRLRQLRHRAGRRGAARPRDSCRRRAVGASPVDVSRRRCADRARLRIRPSPVSASRRVRTMRLGRAALPDLLVALDGLESVSRAGLAARRYRVRRRIVAVVRARSGTGRRQDRLRDRATSPLLGVSTQRRRGRCRAALSQPTRGANVTLLLTALHYITLHESPSIYIACI